MAWSTIRRATEDDVELLTQRAATFAARHGIEIDEPQTPTEAVEATIDSLVNGHGNAAWQHERGTHLAGLWRRIVRRALHSTHATGIAYGHVGFSVD